MEREIERLERKLNKHSIPWWKRNNDLEKRMDEVLLSDDFEGGAWPDNLRLQFLDDSKEQPGETVRLFAFALKI